MPTATDLQSLMVIDSDFEKILSNPILDIAARFWDRERYEVFKVCYRSMREIDDLIDHRKSTGRKFSPEERIQFDRAIQQWTKDIVTNSGIFPFQKVITEFNIPLWPWERLGQAMLYDVRFDGFKSFRTFLRYAEGAAISPASVFVHLCGIERTHDGFNPPPFDIRKAARALALFSYLVHIMRDFEKDQNNNLNYFADDILMELGIDKRLLRRYAENKKSDNRLLSLLARYKDIAGYYQNLAAQNFNSLLPLLEPRYQLSLKIIYSLYSQIFEKIKPENGQIFSDSAPTAADIQKRIDDTVSAFEPAK
jgi:phytoene/squalene synthetase